MTASPQTISKLFSNDFICTIRLTQGFYALVDKSDYENISKHKWFAKKVVTGRRITYYAARSEHIKGEKTSKTVFMHNEILGGLFVDHKNHNTLDNRRCNLRFCTPQQNSRNSRPHINAYSKYKGVTFYKNSTTSKKWGARIVISGKEKWLGIFESEIEAAQAYDLAAIEHFGTFANINEYSAEEIENGKL